MSELIHERPGVYSTYDASTVVSAGQASRAIGVAAMLGTGITLVLPRGPRRRW